MECVPSHKSLAHGEQKSVNPWGCGKELIHPSFSLSLYHANFTFPVFSKDLIETASRLNKTPVPL